MAEKGEKHTETRHFPTVQQFANCEDESFANCEDENISIAFCSLSTTGEDVQRGALFHSILINPDDDDDDIL